jgi:ABC-2 type transport system ATP-binding protein
MQRRHFLATGAAVLGAGLVGPGAATAARPTEERQVTTEDVRIDSVAGAEIAATVYEPAEPHPSGEPAVLMTHGYGGTRAGLAGKATRYAKAGYVAMAYDSRGFGESDGTSGFNGPKEVADAKALLDLLADRDAVFTAGDDPAVGMDGGSYGGGIQLNVAAADDRLDAIIPRITWNSLNQAAAPNDIIKLTWDSVILAAGAPAGYRRGNRPDPQGPDPRIYGFVAEAFATNEVSEEAEAYFRERSRARTRLDDIDVPTLLPQSWTDNLLTPNQALRTFEGQRERGRDTSLVLFPGGGHDDVSPPPAVQAYLDRVSLAWLDRHVHPRRPGESFPTVSYYVPQQARDSRVTSSDPMVGAETFPPAVASPTTLDLGAASPTSEVPLANTAAPTSFRGPTGSLIGSPGEDAAGSSFSFDFTATAPVEVIGRPELRLPVEALGGTAHLFATFEHVQGTSSTVINEQVTALSAPADGVVTLEETCIATQRHLLPGERFRVTVSTTDNGYSASREAAGAVLHTDDATVTVPVDSDVRRPLAPTPPTRP